MLKHIAQYKLYIRLTFFCRNLSNTIFFILTFVTAWRSTHTH